MTAPLIQKGWQDWIAIDCWLSRVVECHMLEAASHSTPSYETEAGDKFHPVVAGSASSIDCDSSSTRAQDQFEFTCSVRSILHFYCTAVAVIDFHSHHLLLHCS